MFFDLLFPSAQLVSLYSNGIPHTYDRSGKYRCCTGVVAIARSRFDRHRNLSRLRLETGRTREWPFLRAGSVARCNPDEKRGQHGMRARTVPIEGSFALGLPSAQELTTRHRNMVLAPWVAATQGISSRFSFNRSWMPILDLSVLCGLWDHGPRCCASDGDLRQRKHPRKCRKAALWHKS